MHPAMLDQWQEEWTLTRETYDLPDLDQNDFRSGFVLREGLQHITRKALSRALDRELCIDTHR